MAHFLLFCIASVPAATIDELMQAPEWNFYSLVRTPDQPLDMRPTPMPVEDFETGFLNWTPGQIRDFIAERLPECIPGTSLEPGGYFVLNDTSVSTQTVVAGFFYSPLMMRRPSLMSEDERDQWELETDEYDFDNPTDTEWSELRISLKDAQELSTSLTFGGDIQPRLHDKEYVATHTNSDGVFDVRGAIQAYIAEYEGSEDEEKDWGSWDDNKNEDGEAEP